VRDITDKFMVKVKHQTDTAEKSGFAPKTRRQAVSKRKSL
jgi:hypothetical protein